MAAEDRISELPDCVLHTILTLIPLKTAATTAVLSKRWTHLFPSIPSLTFGPSATFDLDFDSLFGVDTEQWLLNVYTILESRHQTTIIKSCTISVDHFRKHLGDHFEEVTDHLFDHKIEELNISNRWNRYYYFPYNILSCATLRSLELNRCRFYYVPLKSSESLRTIHLHQVIIADSEFARLVVGCRGLKDLTLSHCFSIKNVLIWSFSLSTLKIITHRPVTVLILKDPRLLSTSLYFQYYYRRVYRAIDELELTRSNDDADSSDGSEEEEAEECEEDDEVEEYDEEEEEEEDEVEECDEKLVKSIDALLKNLEEIQSQASDCDRLAIFLRSLQKVQSVQRLSLEFPREYAKRLSKERVALPQSFDSQHHLINMKKLALRMNVNEANLVQILSLLLNCCPNLEELILGDNRDTRYVQFADGSYWEKQEPSECLVNQLKRVKLYVVYIYIKHWIGIAKFLLRKACVLEDMTVYYNPQLEEKSAFDDVKKEWLLMVHQAAALRSRVVVLEFTPINFHGNADFF